MTPLARQSASRRGFGLLAAAAMLAAGLTVARPAFAAETIPIIVKDTTSFYWQIVLAGARKAGKELGLNVPELGAWVVSNALAVAGPVRETYLVGPRDTADPTAWRTEIGWPVFRMTPRGAVGPSGPRGPDVAASVRDRSLPGRTPDDRARTAPTP